MTTIPIPLCRKNRKTILLIGLMMLSLSGFAASELKPLRAGTELFVDDLKIEKRENVIRRVHAATKLDHPVMKPEKPWEGSDIYLYGTVHRDAGTGGFRMWYCAGSRMLLATSQDGLKWSKPDLDIVLLDGRKTNIVLPGLHGAAVIVDEIEEDPAKRYKVLASEQINVGGFSGYYSADGIHWLPYGTGRLLTVGSELGHAIRDPATRKYFAYIRPYSPKYRPQNMSQKRLCAVVTSDDFVHWSEMKIVLAPDAIDDAWVQEPDQRTELYAMNGFAYGNSYLGIIPLFRITRINDEAVRPQSRYDGPMEGQLVVSRNGLDWHRLAERNPVIASGEAFDKSVLNVAVAPLIVGDEIWHYYSAINTLHGGAIPPRRSTIALARWRLDGYVSLDAGEREGRVETTLLGADARVLEINADASGGQVSVEVLDEAGRVLAGYGAGDGTPLVGNAVKHPVTWKHGASLPQTPFRLRFVFKNASLFSYTLR